MTKFTKENFLITAIELKRIYRKDTNVAQKQLKHCALFFVFGSEPSQILPLNWLKHGISGHDMAHSKCMHSQELYHSTNSKIRGECDIVRDGDGQYKELYEQYVSACSEYKITPSNRKDSNWKPRVFLVLQRSDKQNITTAMDRFASGERPDNFGLHFSWYVEHPQSKTPFPLKAIWALATTGSCNGFKSNDARRKLEKLKFVCIQLSDQNDEAEIQKGVRKSLSTSRKERQKRLEAANPYPERIARTVVTFNRNQDVIAERLTIADGNCEECGQPAPFLRSKNNTPYLEVHHIIPLSWDGKDTVKNTRALCPNCHREAHDIMGNALSNSDD